METSNGFHLSIGKQGSGKTLFITKILVDELEKSPERKVYSNYHLIGINYTHIDLETVLTQLDDDPNIFNHSIICFDEIHLYLDSYDFLKRNNRKLQGFFSQLRKRDILLLGSTQYFMNVDVRIRRQCKYVFDMTHVYKDLFRVITSQVDGYLYYPINTYDIVLSSYYKYYDTNEIITS